MLLGILLKVIFHISKTWNTSDDDVDALVRNIVYQCFSTCVDRSTTSHEVVIFVVKLRTDEQTFLPQEFLPGKLVYPRTEENFLENHDYWVILWVRCN